MAQTGITRGYDEDEGGVHLMVGLRSVCGDVIDKGTVLKTDARHLVTCPKCAAVVLACRGVIVPLAIQAELTGAQPLILEIQAVHESKGNVLDRD